MGGTQESSQSSQQQSSSKSWSVSDFLSNSNSSSQNQSTSQGTSSSATVDSELSNEQLEILQNRENQYNEWFFPELKNAVDNSDPNSPQGQALMEQQSNTINASFESADKQIKQRLAQQGMLGSGNNGVQASLDAQNQRAKTSALSAAYANQLGNMSTQKANLLGIGAGLMTTPTTSAQFHSTSNSQQSAQSTGSSQSTAVSKQHSESGSSSKGSGYSKGSSSGWTVG